MLPQAAFIFSLFFISVTELARILDEVNQSLTDSGPREPLRADPSMSLKLSLFRFLDELRCRSNIWLGALRGKPLCKRSRTRTARDALELSHWPDRPRSSIGHLAAASRHVPFHPTHARRSLFASRTAKRSGDTNEWGPSVGDLGRDVVANVSSVLPPRRVPEPVGQARVKTWHSCCTAAQRI